MTNNHDGHSIINASNLEPGSTITSDVTIGNAGTLPFVLSLTTSSSSHNLLALLLRLTVTKLAANPANDRVIYSGGLTGSIANIETMQPGDTTPFAVTMSLPVTAGNAVQGKLASVDLTWTGQA